MTKHLALSTVLAATLAAGSAFAAGDMDRSAAAQGSVGTTAAATTAGQPSTESVRMMQQALQNEGYDVQVDGIWGPNTQQALNQFQQRHSSMAAAPATGMGSQQALTPDDPARVGQPGGEIGMDRGTEGDSITQELGWDRAGGIREGAQGEPGSLGGPGRGETGVGGGAGGGAGGQ